MQGYDGDALGGYADEPVQTSWRGIPSPEYVPLQGSRGTIRKVDSKVEGNGLGTGHDCKMPLRAVKVLRGDESVRENVKVGAVSP